MFWEDVKTLNSYFHQRCLTSFWYIPLPRGLDVFLSSIALFSKTSDNSPYSVSCLLTIFPCPLPQESGFARQSEEWETQSEAGIAAMREEAEILQNTLLEITHAVKQDADNTSRLLGSPGGPEIEVVDASMLEAEDDFGMSKRPISPSRAARMRSASPTRARSPATSDNALGLIHSAIHKKNLQVQVMLSKTKGTPFSAARVLFCSFLNTRRDTNPTHKQKQVVYTCRAVDLQ